MLALPTPNGACRECPATNKENYHPASDHDYTNTDKEPIAQHALEDIELVVDPVAAIPALGLTYGLRPETHLYPFPHYAPVQATRLAHTRFLEDAPAHAPVFVVVSAGAYTMMFVVWLAVAVVLDEPVVVDVLMLVVMLDKPAVANVLMLAVVLGKPVVANVLMLAVVLDKPVVVDVLMFAVVLGEPVGTDILVLAVVLAVVLAMAVVLAVVLAMAVVLAVVLATALVLVFAIPRMVASMLVVIDIRTYWSLNLINK